MDITILTRKEAEKAQGLCVVIDVLRAFTTAAFAFDRGAKEIVLVSTKEDAFKMREEHPSYFLMGEEHGLPIPGFHYSNSPCEIQQANMRGRTLIQRTSAGTKGVIACGQASHMLLGSFVVAEATIHSIQAYQSEQVSFIITGTRNGDEDLAFAEYASYRLRGKDVPIGPFLEKVETSPTGVMFRKGLRPGLNEQDLDLALQANCFSFAMEVYTGCEILVARPQVVSVKRNK